MLILVVCLERQQFGRGNVAGKISHDIFHPALIARIIFDVYLLSASLMSYEIKEEEEIREVKLNVHSIFADCKLFVIDKTNYTKRVYFYIIASE